MVRESVVKSEQMRLSDIRAKIGHKLPTTFYTTAYRNQMFHNGRMTIT